MTLTFGPAPTSPHWPLIRSIALFKVNSVAQNVKNCICPVCRIFILLVTLAGYSTPIFESFLSYQAIQCLYYSIPLLHPSVNSSRPIPSQLAHLALSIYISVSQVYLCDFNLLKIKTLVPKQ